MNTLPSLDALDDSCQALRAQGAIQACEAAAQLLVDHASAQDRTDLEARGWLYKADCARYRSAYLDMADTARRAVTLLQNQPDHDPDLIEAHTALCLAATALNRTEEALEAGMLACHVVQHRRRDDTRGRALALHAHLALAQALCGATQFAAALQTLQEFGQTAQPSSQTHTTLQIWQAYIQTWQTIHEGQRTPHAASVEALQETLLTLHTQADPVAAQPETEQFLHGWTQVVLTCWQGQAEAARQQLAALRPSTQTERPWLDLLAVWAAAEIAWAQGAWASAEAAAQRVFEEAHQLSHQALADQGARLWSALLAEQGHHAQAMQVLQEMQRRHQGLQGRALTGHTRLAQFLADARDRELRRRTRVALPTDDSLTGLLSRTYFLQLAQELLKGMDLERARCSVLQISITGLNAAVERHGPALRDQVLRAVANLLKHTLRAGDLSARWRDDEFAILLHRSSADDTARVCQRIAQAVLSHDWSGLTQGCAVPVNISHAQARPGDTIDTLMQRSEEEMRSGQLHRQQVAA